MLFKTRRLFPKETLPADKVRSSPCHLEIRHARHQRPAVDQRVERRIGRSRHLAKQGVHGPITTQESMRRHQWVREVVDHHRRVTELELTPDWRMTRDKGTNQAPCGGFRQPGSITETPRRRLRVHGSRGESFEPCLEEGTQQGQNFQT